MKQTDIRTNTKLTILATVAGICLALTSAQANTILDVPLASSDVVGAVVLNGNYTAPSGGQEVRDLAMVNQLVGIYNGNVQAPPYFLSGNSFGNTLPTAVTAGDVITPAGGISFAADGNVTITLGATYAYLIAAYDGPNGGAVVWDIAGLSAGTTIELPAAAQPNAAGDDMVASTRYGITTWSLFNDPTPQEPNVPDGGLTIALLGSALSCLGLLRRKLG